MDASDGLDRQYRVQTGLVAQDPERAGRGADKHPLAHEPTMPLRERVERGSANDFTLEAVLIEMALHRRLGVVVVGLEYQAESPPCAPEWAER